MQFLDKIKQRISNYLLRHLFNAITVDEIVSNHPTTGVLLIDGQPVQPTELRQIQEEIKALEGFRIWTLLTHTTKHMAEEKIFKKSIDMEDVRSGKDMLYNLSLQQSIIDALKKKRL